MGETIISAGAFVSSEEEHFGPCWIAFENGLITDKGVGAPVPSYRGETIVDARAQAIMPGFVNAHTHLEQTLFRGIGVGKNLEDWLQTVARPLERSLSPDDIYIASCVGILENLRAGVTSIVQHHKATRSEAHIDACLRAAQDIGIRLLFVLGWRDLGASAQSGSSLMRQMERLFTTWHTAPGGRIRIGFGPLTPRSCSLAGLKEILARLRGWHVPVHIHVAETESENEQLRIATGLTPIDWLEEAGLLSDTLQIVHGVHLNESELMRIQRAGAHVIHCPLSNLQLGCGIAPTSTMNSVGIKMALGTDGVGSSGSQDIIMNMKMAALVAHVSSRGATTLDLRRVFAIATAEGGRLMGNAVGRLQVGERADLILVDLTSPNLQPHGAGLEALLLGIDPGNVSSVFVDGQPVVVERRCVTLSDTSRRAATAVALDARMRHRN